MGSLNAGPFRFVPPPEWSATEPLVGTDAVVLAPHHRMGLFVPTSSSTPKNSLAAKRSYRP